MNTELQIPVPAQLEIQTAMAMDEAVDLACEELGLPLIGGPSGSGWSMYAVAQRCPHLFRRQYIDIRKPVGGSAHRAPVSADEPVQDLRVPAVPLQVGGLYHTLQAFYYAHGLGEYTVHDRGLIRAELKPMRGRKKDGRTIPADAADKLLAKLKEMAQPIEAQLQASLGNGKPPRYPSAGIIYEAERCFDAHTSFETTDDIEPLAVEWFARHPGLGFTCRYDAIMKVGANDPRFPKDAVVIYERKTAAWLNEMNLTGWFIDGEILGQIMCWDAGGCKELFGPLTAVVVDIVTKAKTPQLHQVIVGADVSAVKEHERWIGYQNSEIALWKATGAYPKRWAACFDKFGKCSNIDACMRGEK